MGTPPASPVENAWPTPSQYRDWFLMLLPEEQLAEAERVVNERIGSLRVFDAVRVLLWRATQFGETEDGDTAAYLLPKGSVHRLVGVMQGLGLPASLRAPH